MNKEQNQKIDVEKIKVGDLFSQIQYYKVVKVNPKTVILNNQKGEEEKWEKELLFDTCSANQYQIEKIVNRSEINQILEKVGQHVFTVNFNKKVKTSDIKNKLLTAIKDKEGNPLTYEEIEKNLKTISKDLNIGEERTLQGYLLEINNQMGRSIAIDLELELDQYRVRQIDHRTINWLIFNGIKYIVKS